MCLCVCVCGALSMAAYVRVLAWLVYKYNLLSYPLVCWQISGKRQVHLDQRVILCGVLMTQPPQLLLYAPIVVLRLNLCATHSAK